jgi:hypothetical protein
MSDTPAKFPGMCKRCGWRTEPGEVYCERCLAIVRLNPRTRVPSEPAGDRSLNQV